MSKHTILIVVCALALSACTSIRVTGFVTNERTGDPVAACGVTFGQFYSSCDAAGHYQIKGRNYWKSLQVVAPGYQPKTVPVDASRTRYPNINIQLSPK